MFAISSNIRTECQMALVRARCKANKKKIFQIIIYAADLWNSFLDKVVGSGSLEDLVFIQVF